MKLEVGGGIYPRGDGWINVDQTPNADVHHDLNVSPWPFADESVEALYSSHCFEHLDDPFAVIAEICRICIVGAPVELGVPHPASHLAMTHGHKHVWSPVAAINIEKYFPRDFWKGKKRLRLDGITYGPTFMLEEAKAELPFLKGLSDETIQRWIPGTCHECRFSYTVVVNEYAPAPTLQPASPAA